MQRLLIIGCGDVALRAAPVLQTKFRLYGLTRNADQFALLRRHGIRPLSGDLDSPGELQRIVGVAQAVLHTAPPPNQGKTDTRTRNLISALGKSVILPRQLVYISTSGVYGDCRGARIDETQTTRPQTGRALRRVDAEQQLRLWGARNQVNISILRAPGIYAAERLSLERLRKGLPVLQSEEDVFTNHIHADDLAQACVAALFRGRPQRVYHASDASELKMGDYFDRLADAFSLPRPPRVSRADAERLIAEPGLSFMRESRRLSNRRLVEELRVRLQFPTIEAALKIFTAKN
jgi:nucleoside-diphosphate-sugar epimerase